MPNVAEKSKERMAGSLVHLFDRTAEKHPFEKNKVGDALECSPREIVEYAQQMITQMERELLVADLDKSKDKSLFWIRRAVGRMVHDYNKYGFAHVLFRFEGKEDMTAKLDKAAYRAISVAYNEDKNSYIDVMSKVVRQFSFSVAHNEDKISYIDKPIVVGSGTGHLYLFYNRKDHYFELGIEGYRAEDDEKAMAMLRKTLREIEDITSS
jgi:hypothetical protein